MSLEVVRFADVVDLAAMTVLQVVAVLLIEPGYDDGSVVDLSDRRWRR